ncbi:MAG: bifunctional pyr operon transcriptional regulator/uracil phosphoribosyltransferase PyrR, partial [Myxococcota bacterium]|nr:bifunctional pyr operon transcriptional regulator/uracil phosphoribosyltransferase PyrR [Myxococcota bacterium]
GAQSAGPQDSADVGVVTSSEALGRADSSFRVVLDDTRIRRALMRIAHEIVESTPDLGLLYLVAIPNGGVPLARRLAANLESLSGTQPQLGILDTTLYRDDLATRGTRPQLRRTEMPSSVDRAMVILVEDVVSTGRTIRAAMDALMDFGRPQSVRVVALVDRGHRELPIKIDYVGKNIPTQPGESVVFREAGSAESSGKRLEVVVETSEGPSGDDSPAERMGELA